MKKSFFTTVLLLAALFLPMAVSAQMLPQLPVDKDVRIGRLPNGLTQIGQHGPMIRPLLHCPGKL